MAVEDTIATEEEEEIMIDMATTIATAHTALKHWKMIIRKIDMIKDNRLAAMDTVMAAEAVAANLATALIAVSSASSKSMVSRGIKM